MAGGRSYDRLKEERCRSYDWRDAISEKRDAVLMIGSKKRDWQDVISKKRDGFLQHLASQQAGQ